MMCFFYCAIVRSVRTNQVQSKHQQIEIATSKTWQVKKWLEQLVTVTDQIQHTHTRSHLHKPQQFQTKNEREKSALQTIVHA